MGGGITFSPDNLSKIPIPTLDDKTIFVLEQVADKYIAYFDANSQDELDKIVGDLYGFTDDDFSILAQFKNETKRKR